MTQTVPDISPLMPMHQDPLLVALSCPSTVDKYMITTSKRHVTLEHAPQVTVTSPCVAAMRTNLEPSGNRGVLGVGDQIDDDAWKVSEICFNIPFLGMGIVIINLFPEEDFAIPRPQNVILTKFSSLVAPIVIIITKSKNLSKIATFHYSDVTWPSWRPRSPTIPVCQQFARANK